MTHINALNKASTGIKKLSLSTFKTLLVLLKSPVNKSSGLKRGTYWEEPNQHESTSSTLRMRSSAHTAPSSGSPHMRHILHHASQNLISRQLDQIKWMIQASTFSFNCTKWKAADFEVFLRWLLLCWRIKFWYSFINIISQTKWRLIVNAIFGGLHAFLYFSPF